MEAEKSWVVTVGMGGVAYETVVKCPVMRPHVKVWRVGWKEMERGWSGRVWVAVVVVRAAMVEGGGVGRGEMRR